MFIIDKKSIDCRNAIFRNQNRRRKTFISSNIDFIKSTVNCDTVIYLYITYSIKCKFKPYLRTCLIASLKNTSFSQQEQNLELAVFGDNYC